MSCTDKALTRQIELYECTVTKYMTAISNAIQQVVKLLFLPSCALKISNQFSLCSQLLQSSCSRSRQATSLLTVCSYLWVGSEQLKSLVHLFLFDSTTQVQEVCWLSSMQVNDVTRGHGQTSSIHCYDNVM